jgi:hypothetical protein
MGTDEHESAGDEGVESEALHQQFEEWRKESIPMPGQDAVPEKSLEEQIQTVSKVVGIRRFSLFILLTLAGLGIGNSYSDFSYFLRSSEPVEVGDVRDAYIADDPLDVLEHNQFVHVENLIPTSVFDSSKFRFYFCPLYKVIVRTTQPVPAKATHKSYFEIEEGEERILEEKLAFVWDLPIHMNATGRLLSVDALPGRYQQIWRSFRNELGERADGKVYLLIDGEEPADFIWFLLAYLASFGLIYFSWTGYVGARRRERRLREELTRTF